MTHEPMAPVSLDVGGRQVAVTHPDKVDLSRSDGRPAHQTRPDPLLPRGRRRRAARRGRPADDPEAVRQGHRPRRPSSRSARRRSGPTGSTSPSCKYASGTSAKEAVIHDAAGLAWAINLGCVDLNPHPVLADDLDHPDELRVDLDPMPGVHVAADRRRRAGRPRGARGPRPDRVAENVGVARLSHLCPHRTRAGRSRQVRLAAQTVAREVERRAPELATSRWWKEEREGVFVDFNQNANDRTVASAYSVRATPDARVSTPLRWDEVAGCRPEAFTVATVPAAVRRASATRGREWTTPPASSTGCSTLAEELGPAEKAPKGARRQRDRPAAVRDAADRDRPHQDQGRGDGRARHLARTLPVGSRNVWSRPTFWSTACAGRVRSGTGSGSTCSMCPTTSGRRRRS